MRFKDKFRSALRPLTKDERADLKASIESDGFRDSIVVWKGHDELVDGFHRESIGEEIGTLPPVEEKKFANEEAVREWIKRNQLGRRNLTPEEVSYERGSELNKTTSKQGVHDAKGESKAETAEKIADRDGVSASTVRRDAKRAESVDKLADALKKQYLDGVLPLTDKELHKLAGFAKSDQLTIARDVRTGTEESFGKALGLKRRVQTGAQQSSVKRAQKGRKEKAQDRRNAIARDKLNREIPTKELLKLFTDERLDTLAKDIKSVLGRIKSLRGGIATYLTVTGEVQRLEHVLNAVKAAKPHAVCPKCKGDKCRSCRQSGFMTSSKYTEYQLTANE